MSSEMKKLYEDFNKTMEKTVSAHTASIEAKLSHTSSEMKSSVE